jgi:hypothetical protein
LVDGLFPKKFAEQPGRLLLLTSGVRRGWSRPGTPPFFCKCPLGPEAREIS